MPAIVTPSPNNLSPSLSATPSLSTSPTPSRSHSPYPPSHPLELANQVGGHAGVQTSEDGSLVFKPALPLEHKFYASVLQSEDGEKLGLGDLRRWVPRFYGTLRLEGVQDEAGEIEEVEGREKKETLVLENLTAPFRKPNILDIKLGTVLYDDDASEEKKARMLKTARDTTSFETGVRLTGFQVYDNTTSKPVNTPKSYGKSIKPSDLPSGIARFFPVPSSSPTSTSSSTPASPPSEPTFLLPTLPSQAISTHTHNQGLPAQLLLPILEAMLLDVEMIREIVGCIEMRMIASSFLFIYEADIEKAKEGVKWMEEHPDGLESDDDEDEEGEGGGEEEEEEEEDDEKAKAKPGPPYIVKLIDFAHTKLTPGEGPDKGLLKGMDTVIELLEGRIEEVKKLVEEDKAKEAAGA